MKKLILLYGLSFLKIGFVWADPPAQAFDLPNVAAIQSRAYKVDHEIGLQAGYLPSDAFNKGYTLGASYTRFLRQYLGWEIINANYSFNSPTDLKKDLRNCCQLQVENNGFNGALDYIEWYALSSIVYTPFYTKSLMFNETLVYGEASLVAGAGVAKFAETGSRPLGSVGFYLRYFTSPQRAIKFDFRDNIYFERTLGAVSALSLMVNYSFVLGGT